jgi:hypothetical protein
MTTHEVQTKPCINCGKRHSVKMDDTQYAGYVLWMEGHGHIQNLIPRLSADDREMLISGTDPVCWNIMFPPDCEHCGDDGSSGPVSEHEIFGRKVWLHAHCVADWMQQSASE